MSSTYMRIAGDLLQLNKFGNQGKISSFITYNTAGGKGFRADLFNLITGTDESSLNASCVFELLQSAFIVIDDVMDNSDVRRGVECYYKKEGMICLRYAQFFICALGRILKKNGSSLRIKYNQCLFDTCLGQILDSRKKLLGDYTHEMYDIIAEYKTAIYSFYLPLSAGYAFKNVEEPKNLYYYCRLVGLIFQMQDDYLNFFPEISKKSGNDLEERKLTFFTCKLIEEDTEYFKNGEVKEEIVEKVKSYFPEYKQKIGELIKEAEVIGKEIEPKVHELIMKLLKKREVD